MSQSMAKTVFGLLVDIAIAEGAIASIDDLAAQYVPDLAGTDCGKTPIRALLQMSSGMAFTETYQGGERRRFSLVGIHGQSMLVEPVSKLVLVHTAVRPNAMGGPSGVELAALWYAVLAHYPAR